jgi:hypothetical protein
MTIELLHEERPAPSTANAAVDFDGLTARLEATLSKPCPFPCAYGSALFCAVDGELKAQAADHTEWEYLTRVREAGKEQVKTVFETPEGDLERLRSANGQPLTPEQEKREDQRIENLIRNRRQQRRLRQEEDEQKLSACSRYCPRL